MSRLLFYHWAKDKYLNDDTPNGDFTMDMVCDRDFPWNHCFTKKALNDYREMVIFHLKKKHACDEAISTFETIFNEYIDSLAHTYESRKDYYKKWRQQNPERIAKYNRDYWNRKTVGESSNDERFENPTGI